MRKEIASVWGVLLCATALAGPVFPNNKPEWTVDFHGGANGYPAHFGPAEKTRGVLVTEHSGRITVISPQGERQLTMSLDLPIETPAIAADLLGDGKLSVVAVDAWGSVYCFDEQGRRQWKFPRAVKSGEFRLPVFADLDGDGRQEIFIPDSRGHLDVLEPDGRLSMEISATKYRVGVPAVGDVTGDGRPEIIFGTEAGDVYCLNNQGDLEWSTILDGCFGRALPLIADADRDGRYEVYFPTAFVNAHPGLFALDAATGKELWKAPSVLQSYRSTVMADLNGDGHNEILFGDKNSRLFCLDADGHQRWTTQLPGRGIFFAPAVADLQGNGASTTFAVVRASGDTGKSLYALDANGVIQDELPLPGGGGCSPILCRFAGRSAISLLVISASGQLECYRLEQNPATSKILRPGIRNDVLNSGFVKSDHPVTPARFATRNPARVTTHRLQALGGTNKLPLPKSLSEGPLVAVKTVQPDGSLRISLIQKAETGKAVRATFTTSEPGNYDVTARSYREGCDAMVRAEHFVYRLARNFKADAAVLREAADELNSLGRQVPALMNLAGYFAEQATAAFARARLSKSPADFNAFHWKCDYFIRLIRSVREDGAAGKVRICQLPNPWENFDAAAFFAAAPQPMNAIAVKMLGNEYESAAVAVSNLRPYPVTLKLACAPFQNGKEQVEAKEMLTLHDVPLVRPDGTGEPTEDPLPLLNEGQTIHLGSGETRKVWLTFHSRSLSAGSWRATLKVGNIAAPEMPVEVPVSVEVYPVRLPDHFTYHECNWLYLQGIRDDTLREATTRDALEHGMNVFCLPGVSIQVDKEGKLGRADTTAHDQIVRELAGRAFFLVFGPVSVQWPAHFQPDARQQEKAFADALRWYGEHMQSLGVGYEDFAIYLKDEPGLIGRGASFNTFVATVKRFKAADPRIQLYANPAGGARAELLQPLEDLIDVWAPDLHLVREQPVALKKIFERGKQYWHYEAPGDQRELDPLGFYRVKPWVAYQMGMTGGGYWVYSSADFWFAQPGGGSEYGSVYPTDKGPVTTKRWEASRDGIEDFELIWLLRKTAERASPSKSAEALRLIDKAVRFVTRGQEKVTDISRHVRPYAPEYAQWMEYRDRLIRMQMQLAK